MLNVATLIKHSPIHGFGCFAAEDIAPCSLVWFFGKTDREVRVKPATQWEWTHAYRSNLSGYWILCRDNAAWINFAPAGRLPNLTIGPLMNGEPTLIAADVIFRDTELTVGPETDADSLEKMGLQHRRAKTASRMQLAA